MKRRDILASSSPPSSKYPGCVSRYRFRRLRVRARSVAEGSSARGPGREAVPSAAAVAAEEEEEKVEGDFCAPWSGIAVSFLGGALIVASRAGRTGRRSGIAEK